MHSILIDRSIDKTKKQFESTQPLPDLSPEEVRALIADRDWWKMVAMIIAGTPD